MDVKQYLQGELEKHVATARGITDKATEAGRSLTEDERLEVDRNVKAAGDVKTRLTDIQGNDELRESIDALGKSLVVTPGSGRASSTPAGSIGDAFVKSAEYKALMARGLEGEWNTGPIKVEFSQKANETVMGSNPDMVPPAYQPSVPGVIPKQPNSIMAAIPQATTDSNVIRYLKETTATNSTASIAELGTYQQSVLVHDNADVSVQKLGTVLFVSDEFLADVSGMASFLDGRLGQFVSFIEEDQAVNGNGTPPQLNGILNQTTQTQALAADTIADAIYKAKTQVRNASFLEPDTLLINATDWQNLRLSKDANDNYLNGLGPFMGGGLEPPVWGLQPYVTARIAQGTALVGAFQPAALQLFRKGGITLSATNSHASLFTAGQVAIRADSRLAMVVYRVSAFCKVTGL
jgi:HK97 family phage major capsid protein